MFDGWMMFAGTELANSARVHAYASTMLPNLGLKDPLNSDELPLILGDEPYSTPALDEAPWVSQYRPASQEFLGFYPTSVTGVDDSTRGSNVTQLTGDGGVASRPRNASREFRVQGLMVATTDRGLDEGRRWLKGVLNGNECDTGDCTGDEFCYLAYLPDYCDYSTYSDTPLDEVLGASTTEWVGYGDGQASSSSNGMRVVMPCGGDGAQRKIAGLIPGQTYRLSLDMATTSEVLVEVAGVAELVGNFGQAHHVEPRSPWVIDFVATSEAVSIRITTPGVDCDNHVARVYGAKIQRTPAFLLSSRPRFNAAATREPVAWTLADAPAGVTASVAVDPTGSGSEVLSFAFENTTGATIELPAGQGASRVLRALSPGRDYVVYANGNGVVLDVDANHGANRDLSDGWVALEFTADTPNHVISVGVDSATDVLAGETYSMHLYHLRVDENPVEVFEDPDQSLDAVRTLHKVTQVSAPRVDQTFKTDVGAMELVSFLLVANIPAIYGRTIPVRPPTSGIVSLVPEIACSNGMPVRTNYAYNPKLAVGTLGATPQWGIGAMGLTFDGADVSAELTAPTVFDANALRIQPLTSDPDATFVELPESGVFVEGHTYTISAEVGVPEPQEGALSDYARRIVVSDGAGLHVSEEHPNVTGGSRVSVTFTLTGALNYVRLYNGAALESGSPSHASANAVLFTRLLVEETAYVGSYFDGDSVDSTWVGVEEESASTWSKSALSAIVDPDCAPLPDAPQPPNITVDCYEAVDTWRRYVVDIPASTAPEWSKSDVLTTLVTGESQVRSVRVRFYDNPFGRLPEQIDPCDFCGEFYVSYIPAETTLTIDGIGQTVVADVAGTGEQIATNLVTGADGGPAMWPELTCDSPYVVTVDIAPEEVLDLDVRVAVALKE